jgi:acetylornithine deacetylase/succinyl-diaminopimelate desuccinylase-like protein
LNLLEVGRRIVSIDSSAEHGNVEVARVLSEIALERKLNVEIFRENYLGVEQALLVISPKKTTAKKHMLFVAHLDTADPGEYFRWDKTGANPFNASIDGDIVYGLGTANAKFDFLAKLKAFSEIADQSFSEVCPLLVGTFGSESGAGATKLLRKRLAQPIGALIGQPTGLTLADRGPGYATLEISVPFSAGEIAHRESHDLRENSHSQSKFFTGHTKHGLEPNFFDNPIVKVFEYLKNLPQGFAVISIEGGTSAAAAPDNSLLELDLVDGFSDSVIPKLVGIYEGLRQFNGEFKAITDEGFSPPHSTFNIGMIRTGTEEVQLTGSCRLVPMVTKEIYEEWLKKLRVRCEASGAKFRVIDYKPPYFTQSHGIIGSTCQKISDEMTGSTFVAAKTASEANVFMRFGIESLVFGAGLSVGNSLTANEHISMKDLEHSLEFYRRAISEICS